MSAMRRLLRSGLRNIQGLPFKRFPVKRFHGRFRSRSVQQFDRFFSRRRAVEKIEHFAKSRAALDDPVLVNRGRMRVCREPGCHLIISFGKLNAVRLVDLLHTTIRVRSVRGYARFGREPFSGRMQCA